MTVAAAPEKWKKAASSNRCGPSWEVARFGASRRIDSHLGRRWRRHQCLNHPAVRPVHEFQARFKSPVREAAFGRRGSEAGHVDAGAILKFIVKGDLKRGLRTRRGVFYHLLNIDLIPFAARLVLRERARLRAGDCAQCEQHAWQESRLIGIL